MGVDYELWFRLAYRRALVSRRMTACIRPGDRRKPNPKGCEVGDVARVRIIAKPGDEATSRLPEFVDHHDIFVKVEGLHVCTVASVPSDLSVRCTSDSWDTPSRLLQLALIYDREFDPKDEVTVVTFRYV